MKNKYFNYCVGYYDDGILMCYCYLGEVNYGSMKDAKELLKIAKKNEPECKWEIIKIGEK